MVVSREFVQCHNKSLTWMCRKAKEMFSMFQNAEFKDILTYKVKQLLVFFFFGFQRDAQTKWRDRICKSDEQQTGNWAWKWETNGIAAHNTQYAQYKSHLFMKCWAYTTLFCIIVCDVWCAKEKLLFAIYKPESHSDWIQEYGCRFIFYICTIHSSRNQQCKTSSLTHSLSQSFERVTCIHRLISMPNINDNNKPKCNENQSFLPSFFPASPSLARLFGRILFSFGFGSP